MNNNYESVYRNTGTTPRKMHRVEDHYALHTFKSETREALEFLGDMLVGLTGIACLVFLGYAVLTWLR